MIYDGPFSESSEKLEAKGLTGETVSQEQAQKIAEEIAGVPLTSGGISDGEIRSYDFSMSDENGGWAEVSITEQGGSLLWYMSNSTSNQEESRRNPRCSGIGIPLWPGSMSWAMRI